MSIISKVIADKLIISGFLIGTTLNILNGNDFIKPVMAETSYKIVQSVWSRFTSNQYNFSILMPGDPFGSRLSIGRQHGRNLYIR